MTNLEDRLTKAAWRLHQEGKSLAEIFAYLQTKSDSKLLMIAVLGGIIRRSLEDANLIVRKSKTPQGTRKRDEQFHEKIHPAMEKMRKKKSRSK
jgi:hypothetical protein